MTHSGGRPHAVGDKGQRYEIRATGYPAGGEHVIGWTDRMDRAESIAASILKAPSCTASRIIDRQQVGMDWKLSEDAKARIAEIDRHIVRRP
jgi:hypothetical protein